MNLVKITSNEGLTYIRINFSESTWIWDISLQFQLKDIRPSKVSIESDGFVVWPGLAKNFKKFDMLKSFKLCFTQTEEYNNDPSLEY